MRQSPQVWSRQRPVCLARAGGTPDQGSTKTGGTLHGSDGPYQHRHEASVPGPTSGTGRWSRHPPGHSHPGGAHRPGRRDRNQLLPRRPAGLRRSDSTPRPLRSPHGRRRRGHQLLRSRTDPYPAPGRLRHRRGAAPQPPGQTPPRQVRPDRRHRRGSHRPVRRRCQPGQGHHRPSRAAPAPAGSPHPPDLSRHRDH